MKKPFNTLKLQQEILKIDERENSMKAGTYKERPAIITEGGTAAYIFLKEDFKLDASKFRNMPTSFDNFISGMERAATEELHITGKKYRLNDLLLEFNDDIYVNDKLIASYIDVNAPEIFFKGSAHNMPVLVYMYDKLVAIFMPVNIKKGGVSNE